MSLMPKANINQFDLAECQSHKNPSSIACATRISIEIQSKERLKNIMYIKINDYENEN